MGREKRGRGLLALSLVDLCTGYLVSLSPGLAAFEDLVGIFLRATLKGLVCVLSGSLSALRYCSRGRAGWGQLLVGRVLTGGHV